ncbi:MAG: glycosyl hydrolase [Alistipes sp.]
MNSLFISVLLFVASLCAISCEKNTNDDPNGSKTDNLTSLKLADPKATPETKALYSNLWAIQSRGFMFGHHDDLMYGRTWYNVPGKSDTKDVCGDYPAVYSMDFAAVMDDRYSSSTEENAIMRRCMIEAYDRGMVIIACMHINNPLTGKDAWDNTSNQVAHEIMTSGSDTNVKFNSWLDRLSLFAQDLRGSDGKVIPVIFRPFHEHTQGWSWWGSQCTTSDEFIALWHYVVDYLRDKKGVHNFIYALSPQMDSAKTEADFYYRWPGDNYVDFIGMDCYQGINNAVFVTNLKSIVKASQNKHKPCGVTETGVEGFSATDYWTTNIHAPLTGRKVSMVITWRNKYDPNEGGTHYYSVFPGHPSERDFVKMYNQQNTFFCSDLPNMYAMADGITVE